MLSGCCEIFRIFKFGISAHLDDITELHKLRGDFKTDNNLESFPSYSSHVIIGRDGKERIKSLVKYRKRKCRNVEEFLEFEFLKKPLHVLVTELFKK